MRGLVALVLGLSSVASTAACRKADPQATPKVPAADDARAALPDSTTAPPDAPVGATVPLDAADSDAAPPFTGTTSYPGLVVPGARWTFRAHRADEEGQLDDDPPFSRRDPTFTCTVDEAVTFGNGRAASITCEGEASDNSRNPLYADFADTPAGVYALETMPEPGATLALDEDGLILAAHPVEAEITDEDDDGGTHQITRRGDGWCVSDRGGGDYSEGSQLCLDATGPIGGYWYYEDLYLTHVTYFERVATPKPKPHR